MRSRKGIICHSSRHLGSILAQGNNWKKKQKQKTKTINNNKERNQRNHVLVPALPPPVSAVWVMALSEPQFPYLRTERHGVHLALALSAHGHFTFWLCCPHCPGDNAPARRPVMCCAARGSVMYGQAARLPSAPSGRSVPSTIFSVIITGLMGDGGFLPALQVSAQGERLRLLSLG